MEAERLADFFFLIKQQTSDVTDITVDDVPSPMEIEELPNVHDCGFILLR